MAPLIGIVAASLVVAAGADESEQRQKESPWTTNFAAAKAEAAAQEKDLLLNFTGSDWCGFCISLRDQVFGTPVFEKAASEHFVLVELDYPRHQKQPAELQKQNEKLRLEFGIEGFPTLFLADCEGRVYGNIPNQPDITPKQFVAQMEALRSTRQERDQMLEAARKLEGLKRAEKLHQALKDLDDEIVERFYGETVDEIISLDENDKLKRKKNRLFAKELRGLEEEVHRRAQRGDRDGIAAAIDEFLDQRKLKGEHKQRVMMLKIGLYGADQLDSVLELLDKIIKVKPDSDTGREAEEIRMRVGRYKMERLAAEKVRPDSQ